MDITRHIPLAPFLTSTPSGALEPYKFDSARPVGFGPPPKVVNSDMTAVMAQFAKARGIKIFAIDK
jgi:hypothetical protein